MTRDECRAAVKRRACGCCERCGVPVKDTYPDWHWRRAHVNEKVPRSLGGDPTDPANCELVCQLCHLPDGGHAPTKARMDRLRKDPEWP